MVKTVLESSTDWMGRGHKSARKRSVKCRLSQSLVSVAGFELHVHVNAP